MHGMNIIYLGFTKSSKAPAVSHLSKEGRTNLNLSETSWNESTNLGQTALNQSLFLTEDPYQEKDRKNKPEKSNIYVYWRRREESYLKAKELLDAGDEEGYKKMAESIDISPDMAYHLIVELKKHKIEFIVAPY